MAKDTLHLSGPSDLIVRLTEVCRGLRCAWSSLSLTYGAHNKHAHGCASNDNVRCSRASYRKSQWDREPVMVPEVVHDELCEFHYSRCMSGCS